MAAIVTFLRLTLLRPIERFLAQCVSISSQPSAFVREHVHLGDTTNFLRAAGFFVSAVSTAFLAEVATLHLLGIGDLAEAYADLNTDSAAFADEMERRFQADG